MPFKAATYNVLASAYLHKGDYSVVSPELLRQGLRTPARVRHVGDLKADLICLQEVEAEVFVALRKGLTKKGYHGHLELKGREKPDGCATFYRTELFTLREARRLEYQDNEKGPGQHSGFVALLLALEYAGRLLGVANTHLRWDRPTTPAGRHVGRRQVLELLQATREFEPRCDGWLLCGDLNSRPDSLVIETIRTAGLEYARRARSRPIGGDQPKGRLAGLPVPFRGTSGRTARPAEGGRCARAALRGAAFRPSRVDG